MAVLPVIFGKKLRESFTLALLALLPFHALLVTVGTKWLLGPAAGAPMPILAGWKEGLLAAILLIALMEFMRKPSFKIDLTDGLIIALLAIALLLPKTNFLFGFKYDFIPLVAFLILRRVSWSEKFLARIESLLLWVAGIAALYGILSFFLPTAFFTSLGYSDAHSLYLPAGPLAAFQQISGTSVRRIQSAFSGPNQFGIWLLIPIGVCLAGITHIGEKLKMQNAKCKANYQSPMFPARHLSFFIFLAAALIFTFSRSAWIAAFVIGCVAVRRMVSKKFFSCCILSFLILATGMSLLFPPVFIRPISLAGHVERPLRAVLTMIKHPFGLGLGSAGPAANRTHEPCVYLERGADPSWAASSPQLCVFAGDLQIQPIGHVCDCAMLPENWYIQIGVELGVPGFLLYGGLILLVLRRLSEGGRRKEKTENAFS
ncbi:O-antigen ligase family protein, partial [Candidatus Peregrinibacteria bacterium]|nr:O-antigen ligase family protein [Candidatus Peregrinibacteria bacterium]